MELAFAQFTTLLFVVKKEGLCKAYRNQNKYLFPASCVSMNTFNSLAWGKMKKLFYLPWVYLIWKQVALEASETKESQAVWDMKGLDSPYPLLSPLIKHTSYAAMSNKSSWDSWSHIFFLSSSSNAFWSASIVAVVWGLPLPLCCFLGLSVSVCLSDWLAVCLSVRLSVSLYPGPSCWKGA